LSKKKIVYYRIDLHKGIDLSIPKVDVCVMIISLCQFRMTGMDSLLNDFKKIAHKVVIVEHVVPEEVREESLWYKLNNYLIARDYTVKDKEFTSEQFQRVMVRHGYKVRQCGHGYMTGLFDGG